MVDDPQPGGRPFVSGPQEGEAVWYLGVLKQMKAPAEVTGGRISVAEQLMAEGSSPPLHVHHREDEAFYVLEGRLTCRAGSFVWLPRGVPHTFRVDSPTARILTVCVPGGFERFFDAIGRPAERLALPPPPGGPPDVAAMAGHAHDHGVELLGPPMT